MTTTLAVENLSTTFFTKSGEVRAVDDVSFTAPHRSLEKALRHVRFRVQSGRKSQPSRRSAGSQEATLETAHKTAASGPEVEQVVR